jgi:hypothetical protein
VERGAIRNPYVLADINRNRLSICGNSHPGSCSDRGVS